MTKSIFEEIPGMGKKRIQRLWLEFSSLKDIKEASVADISSRTGFSKKLSSDILESAKKEG